MKYVSTPEINKNAPQNHMATTLEKPFVDNDLSLDRDSAVIAEVIALQDKEKQEWRELFTTSPEVRQAVGDAIKIRQELDDPLLKGINYDEVMSYDDFQGARQAMRFAYDFRTKDDGTYGERKDADQKAAKYFYPGLTKQGEEYIHKESELAGIYGDHLPKEPNAETGLVLGCKAKGFIDRGKLAKEQMDAGAINVKKLVFLGSERPVDDAERRDAAEFAPDATTEFEVAIGIAETLYNVKIEAEDIETWVDHSIEPFPLEGQVEEKGIPYANRIHKVAVVPGDESVNRPNIFIVSSAIVTDPLGDATKDGHPIKIVRNRANSADTFETYARLERPEPGTRVTMFTRSIFAFQKIAAMNRLGKRGVVVDVASYGATHFGGPEDPPHVLGMELLSIADALAADEKLAA